MATLTIKDNDANKNDLMSKIVISLIVNGSGSLGRENNMKITNRGKFIVCDEKIDNIEVKIVENPLKGSNTW